LTPVVVFAGAHAAHAADDEPLEFTGTFTYTPDVATGTIHAVLDMDVLDLGKSQRGSCWSGIYIPVPSNLYNVHNNGYMFWGSEPQPAKLRRVELYPLEGSVAYKRALVFLAGCLNLHERSHSTLTFDFDAGAPRSDNPIRLNESYIGFDAIGLGRPSNVAIQVVLPESFEPDHLDSRWKSTTSGGLTTYTLPPFTEANYPDTYVGARDDSALVDVPVETESGQEFSVMQWPNDPEWGQFIADQVERGVPALTEAVGADWPIDGETQIREAYSNYFDGYAGWFNPDSNEMQLGDDLEQIVVLHELSHAWFNDDWFSDRWLSEGFAEAYAAIVMQQLGGEPNAPIEVSTDDPGAVALETWADPTYSTDGTDDTEQYGYATSYYIVSTLVDEIGVDKMREVLRMVDSGETVYTGDGDAEVWNEVSDWKDFLDLVEVVGGSTQARDLMEKYVVSTHSRDSLDDRDAARASYAALDDRGADWATPVAVRKSIDQWNFNKFDDLAEAADATLDLRDQLAELCIGLDIALPTDLEAAYEDAENADELTAAQGLANDYITAALALTEATDAKNGSHGVFGAIGLIASDADSELNAAREAFDAHDPQSAVDHAHKVVGIVDDATGQGLLRIGLVVLVVLLVLGLIWFLRRRKARRQALADAAPTAEAAAEGSDDPALDLAEEAEAGGAAGDDAPSESPPTAADSDPDT